MISFDLDMTLLDHATGQITPSALRAIELLRKNHRIVLATGRDMDNYYSSRFRDIVKPDAIVHMNGTKVTADGKLLYEHEFDKGLLKEVLSYCDAKGFAVGVTVGDEDFYIHPEVVEESDRLHWGIAGRRFQDPWRLLDMKVRTLAFVGNEEQAARMERDFPMLKMPMFAGKHGADVIEKGYSKADGLRVLAKYYGEKEDLSGTVAFGDSMNDVEVIRAAGTGVAMGNAVKELKDCADLVTDTIENDGIWKACVRLGLFGGDGEN